MNGVSKACAGPDGPPMDQKLDSVALSGSVAQASSLEANRDRLGDPPMGQEPLTPIPLFASSSKAGAGPDGPPMDQKLDSVALSGSVAQASSLEAGAGPDGPLMEQKLDFAASSGSVAQASSLEANRDRLCDPPMSQEPSTPIPLFASSMRGIRSDLEAVRECLQHAGLAPAEAMAERLHSVVQQLLQFQGEASRTGLEQIRTELRQLQPLFDHAYELQSGWFKLALPDPGAEYDRTGNLRSNGGH